MSSLNPQLIARVRFLQRQAASLLLYQSVLTAAIGGAFLHLLATLERESDSLDCLQAYGSWFQQQAVHQQGWQDYLIAQILRADNPFSQQAQQTDFQQLPSSLIAAAKSDLQCLQSLYQCGGEQLSQWIQQLVPSSEPPVVWQPEPDRVEKIEELPLKTRFKKLENWADAVEELAAHYRQFGVGLFASSHAYRWQNGELIGISHPDPVHLSQLIGYDSQRKLLLQNTEFLLAGYAAQNVLLYGSRGSGKSSLIKALLHQYGDRGLRLIEVAKSDLIDLPLVIERLRGTPHKFIIFVDDLSFEEDDDTFKALKMVLEGNITARPQNVVVYATSNRRHLVREYFAERPQPREVDEVQAWDTVQEKLSFSDRFGLTLTFEPPDQETYLKMVAHLAALAGIDLDREELEFRALQWATRHNGRSGRSARQFVDFLGAELALFSVASDPSPTTGSD